MSNASTPVPPTAAGDREPVLTGILHASPRNLFRGWTEPALIGRGICAGQREARAEIR